MKLIFDLEGDAFLEDLSQIFCIVCKDISTNKVYRFNPDNLEEALKLLKQAELLIGHNIQGYDLPALFKIFKFKYDGAVFDTLLCSRLIWTNRQEADYKYKDVPPKLIGKHSLEAWGYRLGLRKGNYAEEHGDKAFVAYTKELEDYCANDVEVTHKLYDVILKQNYSKEAIELKSDYGIAHRHLSSMLTYLKKDDPHLKKMESVYKQELINSEDRIQLAFGLGKAYEDLAEYEKAFNYFEDGNRLYRDTIKYSTEGRERFFSLLKENFDKDFLTSSFKANLRMKYLTPLDYQSMK